MRFDVRLYVSYLSSAVIAMVGFFLLNALCVAVRTSRSLPAAAWFVVALLAMAIGGIAGGLRIARVGGIREGVRVYLRQGSLASVQLGSPLFTGIEVLIVEADVRRLNVLTRTLVECGAQARIATSFGAASAALEDHLPDVLVADVTLPPGGRVRQLMACVESCAQRERKRPVCIATSAFSEVIDESKVMVLGFDAFLSMPFAVEELVELIQERLKSRQLAVG